MLCERSFTSDLTTGENCETPFEKQIAHSLPYTAIVQFLKHFEIKLRVCAIALLLTSTEVSIYPDSVPRFAGCAVVAMGNPARHMRKASHCASKQQ